MLNAVLEGLQTHAALHDVLLWCAATCACRDPFTSDAQEREAESQELLPE